jgi:glutamine amidotransferase
MLAIIDYGAGNLESVRKALAFLGVEVLVTADPAVISGAEGVLLPGVGSFGDCMENMRTRGLLAVTRATAESGKPFLGICLGLQLLFESSEESPGAPGLGLLRGKVLRIPRRQGLKIPHIGWNSLEFTTKCSLFDGIPQSAYVYFVHSFYLRCEQPEIVTAKTQYGVSMDAAIQKDNLFATQFHPEKSGAVGLKILENFIAKTRV